MIKSELVLKIAEQNPHLYQRDVENIVNAILDTIADALARGDRVELRGFGAFSVKKRDARTGRNPRTGETVSVAEKVISPKSSPSVTGRYSTNTRRDSPGASVVLLKPSRIRNGPAIATSSRRQPSLPSFAKRSARVAIVGIGTAPKSVD